MTQHSAGILLFRHVDGHLEVLLAHMGGPLWAKRDVGAWTIPKGEYSDDEDPMDAAIREFEEELGLPLREAAISGQDFVSLGEIRQSGGKRVVAWAVEGDLDPARVTPGTFTMEWPRGSGRMREFPEIDRVAWLGIEEARDKVIAAQLDLLRRFV